MAIVEVAVLMGSSRSDSSISGGGVVVVIV